MTQEEKFFEALKKFTAQAKIVVPGTIIKVDEEAKTCDVKPDDGGAPLLAVKLKPTRSSKSGFWPIPSVGSNVLVGKINNKDTFTFLAMYSDVDKVIWVTKEASFELGPKNVVVNGGKKGGIPIAQNLADALNQQADRIAKLEEFAATHTHTSTAPGGPTSTSLPPFVPPVVKPLKATDLENPDFKQ